MTEQVLRWRDKLCIDAVLPFGRPPRFFNAVADAMEWIFRSQGIELTMHYLDNFVVFGVLSTAVVKPGRTFLRGMISLATSVRELHFKVRLNRSFRSDLGWWASFLPAWG